MKKKLIPALVFPPGELLKDELEARQWTQKHLAELMNRPLQVVNEVINGKKAITAQTSIELSKVFDCSEQFWLTLEMNYQLYLARKRMENKSFISRAA